MLLASEATRERIAIPWLHVLREHPTFLAEYESLLGASTSEGFTRIIRYQAGWLRNWWRAFWSNGLTWVGPVKFSRPVEILFISHLLDTSPSAKQVDFYFSDLPERVRAVGHEVVVGLIDHTGKADRTFPDSWQKNGAPRVIFSNSLGLLQEMSLYARLRKESLRLAGQSRAQASALLARVFARASVEALSGSARTTLRLACQVGQLVRTIRPKIIVTTYEGHAWERLVFASAREAHPGIECIGYQHAAIFRMQHSALRKLAPSFNPDRLLTAGAVGKMQLDEAPGLRGLPVDVLGSSRATHTIAHGKTLPQKLHTCLVLPEGIASECILLFEFSLSCAKLLPHMHFVWRLHPLVAFESLTDGKSRFCQLPENVELSRATMEEDVARADCALYRGSTAIVKAVSAGVLPIYLEQAGEMSIDPLYQLEGWRKNVADFTQFRSVVETPQFMTEAVERSRSDAIEYCEAFYSPFQASVLLEML